MDIPPLDSLTSSDYDQGLADCDFDAQVDEIRACLRRPCSEHRDIPNSWTSQTKQQVVVLDSALDVLTFFDEHRTEANKVLAKSFFPDEPLGHDDVAARLLTRYGYEVVRVVRVQDTRRRQMYDSFRTVYRILNEANTFYGASPVEADLIAQVGIRAEAGQRARLGNGVYTMSNVWEALASAEPDSARDFMQELFVCKVALGSCEFLSEGGGATLGSCSDGTGGEVGFGCTMHGGEILTRTNMEQTIFCCKYENQVVVEYRVQLRIALRASVDWGLLLRTQRIHHADVHAAIRAQSASSTVVLAQNITRVATEEVKVQVKGINRIDTFRFPVKYKGFQVGGRVEMAKMSSDLQIFMGERGVIKQIARRVDGHGYFMVELDRREAWPNVKAMQSLKLPKRQEHWLVCKVGAMRKIYL